jgi:hypothetical protein
VDDRQAEDSAARAAAAAAAAAEATRRRTDSIANARRQLLCGSSATAERALSDGLAGDGEARLGALYGPRVQADTPRKASVTRDMRNGRNLRVSGLSVQRVENAGDACDWIVQLRFNWQDGFGRQSNQTLQMRLRLEFVGEQVRAARLFGAVRQ